MENIYNARWNRTFLSCTAICLAILIGIQIVHQPTARAQSMQGKGGVSMATIRNGFSPNYSSPSCLWVIDDSSEMLLIFCVEGGSDGRIQRRYGESLPTLFRQARGN